MGQFSWKCSDTGNALINRGIRQQKNCTTKAYLLIPAEFGGGHYFVDNEHLLREYDGFGHFFDETGIDHDAFEELAKWNGLLPDGFDHNNRNMVLTARSNAIEKYYTPEDPAASPYEDGNYNSPKILKYPLKITEKPIAYELAMPSTDDPNQGWGCDDGEYGEDDEF